MPTPGPNPIELLGGVVLSAAIAVVAYRQAALTAGGALGAVLTGSVVFGLGGWEWGMLLVAFFVSSSLLSRYRAADKAGLAEKFAKGSRRDLGQALANAGVAAAAAIAHLFVDHPLLYVATAGAFATVNADTWATELGVLSRKPPRLITTGRVVEVGASGGITPLGAAVSLAGAVFIASLAGAGALVGRTGAGAAKVAASATVGGFVGSLVDSLLGATLQAVYYCPSCGKETEQRIHRCGTAADRIRGWTWLNNDWVNFLSSAAGALIAVALTALGWGNLG